MTAKKASAAQPKDTTAPKSPSATVVLSGGAPNSPLMSGALAAIYKAGKTFNHFYTSGAGAVPALMFLAPKFGDAYQMLEESVGKAAISDEIYRWIPLGYKAFFKPGPFAAPILRWAQAFKLPASSMGPEDSHKRLYNDLVDLWATAITPTWISPKAKGVCPPYPFVGEVIDFDKLKAFEGTFVLNAYDIDHQKLVEFTKDDLDVAKFAAAFAFPFVYQPVNVDGVNYSEGAGQDPLNLPNLHDGLASKNIVDHTVLLLDVLGSMRKALVRVPRNLIDAYGIQIMTPVVSLADSKKKEFLQESEAEKLKTTEKLDGHTLHRIKHGQGSYDFHELSFDIPPEHLPYTTEWSFSNMSLLWKIGLDAGQKFIDVFGNELPDRKADGASPQQPHQHFS